MLAARLLKEPFLPMTLRLPLGLLFLIIFCTLCLGQSKARAGKPQPPPAPSVAPHVDEKLFNAMRWRQVGPFRGGRVLAVTGVPGEPSVFYFGAASGGVWKSSDAGANWQPLFDKQP